MKKTLKYGQAAKFDVSKNDFISIVVVSENPQLSDLWARQKNLPSVTYHPGLTIDNSYDNGKRLPYARTGTILYDSDEEPIMKIIDDGGFKHDLMMPGCRKSVYKRHGRAKRGCRDIIAEVMDIPTFEIMGTFNLFYEMEYTDSGIFIVKQVRAGKGSYCKFLALEDLEIAVTACPAVKNVVKGKGAIEVEIL